MGKLVANGIGRTRSRLTVPAVAAGPSLPVTANLWLWLDASYAPSITASGGAVSQWSDLSGNTRDATQGSAGAKPTTGSRTINSLNVLDFDGGDWLAGSGSMTTATYTVFMVTGTDADVSGYKRFMAFHSGSGNDYDSNNAFTITAGTTTAQMTIFQGVVNLSSGGATATAIGTWTVRHGTGTNEYQITNPAGTTVQTTNSSSGTASSGFLIGAGYESGASGTNPFDGPMGEVIVYNATLSDGDRTTIRNYLIAKWGA